MCFKAEDSVTPVEDKFDFSAEEQAGKFHPVKIGTVRGLGMIAKSLKFCT